MTKQTPGLATLITQLELNKEDEMAHKHYLVNISKWDLPRLFNYCKNACEISLLPKLFVETRINPETRLNEVWLVRED